MPGTVIGILIISAAAFILIRSFYRQLSGRHGKRGTSGCSSCKVKTVCTGCGSCGGCPFASNGKERGAKGG